MIRGISAGCFSLLLSIAGGMLFGGGLAQGAESAVEYEKVLVPIVLRQPLPGAFGSLWTSEFWVRNESSQRVDVRWYDWCDVCVGSPPPPVPPGVTFRPRMFAEPPGFQGIFLFVDRQYASDIEFGLRVRDLSRQSMTWGTEVPVVREAQFRTNKLTLIDIPAGSGFRQVLRIYEFDGSGVAQVAIRIYKLDPGNVFPSETPDPLLGTRIVTFRAAGPDSSSIYPGYIEVSDLSQIAPLTGSERVRIEVEPLTPGLRYWAFVTVVNNDTQHLTVISPSP